MNTEKYGEALSQDRDYVTSQVTTWKAKLEEAKRQLEYWELQEKAIVSVSSRVNLSGDCVFYKRADEK